eukprot:CAMPEP_0203868710 /NCGR_PEP_ID=MMETSP0359-20131031/17266_1 /ASSEMBLY_ACC=CAM_ASM_000338 /TAXON_ID=268821 /ORGANISM="Scrippsiella Hangoei, Strain SHTV-5" /LENGTH=56 /DNA_ID=CAMNT_0050787167 /DNA_START=67 /DNA_END=234 /DNA_ORIENTATION=+
MCSGCEGMPSARLNDMEQGPGSDQKDPTSVRVTPEFHQNDAVKGSNTAQDRMRGCR